MQFCVLPKLYGISLISALISNISIFSSVDAQLSWSNFTCSKTHYKPGVRQHQFKRAVERRAEEIVKEYQKKADKMDRLLGEGEEDEEGRGRIWRRLDQFGDLVTVVVGKHNELSDGGHFLLDAMAAS